MTRLKYLEKTSVYLLIFSVKLHTLANFITNLLLGTKKNHPLIPFSNIFDTPRCYKTHLLNKKVSNLALEMWFLSVFCHLTPQPGQFLLVKIHFKSSRQLLDMRNYPLNTFSSIFDTPGNSIVPNQEFVYAMNVACTIQPSWYFFHARISFPEQFY